MVSVLEGIPPRIDSLLTDLKKIAEKGVPYDPHLRKNVEFLIEQVSKDYMIIISQYRLLIRQESLQTQLCRVEYDIFIGKKYLHSLFSAFYNGTREIEAVLDEYKKQLVEETKQLMEADLIMLSHKIAYTASAPADFEREGLSLSKPPFPQDAEMRSGVLYEEIDLTDYYEGDIQEVEKNEKPLGENLLGRYKGKDPQFVEPILSENEESSPNLEDSASELETDEEGGVEWE